MDLYVNGHHYQAIDLVQLRAHIEMVRQQRQGELDLFADEESENGSFFSLTVLVNEDRAVLFSYRYEGDTGLISCDPDYNGRSFANCAFTLGNGQIDRYPLSWTVHTEEALDALEYTFLYKQRAPSIVWDTVRAFGETDV